MYDHIIINKKKLPVSEDIQDIIGTNQLWQTKSLKCMMWNYVITNNDKLTRCTLEYAIPEAMLQDSTLEEIDYNGTIIFHTFVGDDLYEFIAEFNKGYMITIKEFSRT